MFVSQSLSQPFIYLPLPITSLSSKTTFTRPSPRILSSTSLFFFHLITSPSDPHPPPQPLSRHISSFSRLPAPPHHPISMSHLTQPSPLLHLIPPSSSIAFLSCGEIHPKRHVRCFSFNHPRNKSVSDLEAGYVPCAPLLIIKL